MESMVRRAEFEVSAELVVSKWPLAPKAVLHFGEEQDVSSRLAEPERKQFNRNLTSQCKHTGKRRRELAFTSGWAHILHVHA